LWQWMTDKGFGCKSIVTYFKIKILNQTYLRFILFSSKNHRHFFSFLLTVPGNYFQSRGFESREN
jgi:hypothetical protein